MFVDPCGGTDRVSEGMPEDLHRGRQLFGLHRLAISRRSRPPLPDRWLDLRFLAHEDAARTRTAL